MHKKKYTVASDKKSERNVSRGHKVIMQLKKWCKKVILRLVDITVINS